MHRLFVLASLLGLMVALQALRVDFSLSEMDPLTLAAIGFVIIGAYTVGEILATIGLPRISGYILSGVLFGPHISKILTLPVDILSDRVVKEMGVFNTLALGLIAITAGLELEVKATRKVLGTLSATVALKIPLLLGLVGGAFIVIETYFPSLSLSRPELLVMALVFAVLGIGTSPSISLAMVNELKAKGRLADLTLAIAVVKDLVVVLLLALAVAISHSLLQPAQGFNFDSLLHVGIELGLSVAFGAALGASLIAYVKYVNKELLLVLVGVILLSAEASKAWHLELLLVFIAAGFTVRNFSRFEHEFLSSLQRVSLPIYVVFFTTAGATVDLAGTLKVLPLAGTLVLARIVAYYVASNLGARLGGESKLVRSNSWMAYLPQAGVTLGLVLLASQSLPELADPIRRTGMAVVALNLLMGPIFLGLALRRAGEVPGVTSSGSQAEANHPSSPLAARGSEVSGAVLLDNQSPINPADISKLGQLGQLGQLSQVEQVLQSNEKELSTLNLDEERPPSLAVAPDVNMWKQQIKDSDIAGVIEVFKEELLDIVARWQKEEIHSRIENSAKLARRTFAELKEEEHPAETLLRQWSTQAPDLSEGLQARFTKFHLDLVTRFETLPEWLDVPMRPDQWADDITLDKAIRKTRKYHRWTHWSPDKGRRVIPLRLLARYCIEKVLCESVADSAVQALLTFLEMEIPVRQLLAGRFNVEECKQAIQKRVETHSERIENDLLRTLAAALSELALVADRIGAPGYPSSDLRLSQRGGTQTPGMQWLASRMEQWRTVSFASIDTLRAEAALRFAEQKTHQAVEERCQRPISLVKEDILPLVEAASQRAKALLEKIPANGNATQTIDSILNESEGVLSRRDRNRFSGLRTRYRQTTQAGELLASLSVIVETIPKKLVCIKAGSLDWNSPNPLEAETVTRELSYDVERILVEGFVPRFMDTLHSLSETVAGGDERLDEVAGMLAYAQKLMDKAGQPGENELKASRELLQTSSAMLTGLADNIRVTTQRAEEDLTKVYSETVVSLQALLTEELDLRHGLGASVSQTQRAARKLFHNLEVRTRSIWRATLQRISHLIRSQGVPGWFFEENAQGNDARSVRLLLEKSCKSVSELQLPALAKQVFTTDPLEDQRLASAYPNELQELIQALQNYRKSSVSPLSMVIVGERGSGRTTFVNIAELRLARQRVVRLDPRFHRRSSGILEAVASELGCASDTHSLTQTLRSRRPIVVIDDLDQYIMPDALGIEELDRLLTVMASVSGIAGWIVSIERSAARLLSEVCRFEESFAQRIHLPPLRSAELQSCIEQRARLAGLNLEYEGEGLISRFLPRQSDFVKLGYYRRLARYSGGNLRAALEGHLRALRPQAETERLALGLPKRPNLEYYLRGLSPEALGTLVQLAIYGPMAVNELSRCLSLEEGPCIRALLPLRLSGIAVGANYPPGAWRLAPESEWTIRLSLEELGLLLPEAMA